MQIRKGQACLASLTVSAGETRENYPSSFIVCTDHQRLSAPYFTVCMQCIADLRAYFMKISSYVRVINPSYKTCSDVFTHLKRVSYFYNYCHTTVQNSHSCCL